MILPNTADIILLVPFGSLASLEFRLGSGKTQRLVLWFQIYFWFHPGSSWSLPPDYANLHWEFLPKVISTDCPSRLHLLLSLQSFLSPHWSRALCPNLFTESAIFKEFLGNSKCGLGRWKEKSGEAWGISFKELGWPAYLWLTTGTRPSILQTRLSSSTGQSWIFKPDLTMHLIPPDCRECFFCPQH